MPKITFVIRDRDVNFKFQDKRKNPLTENEYLEYTLAQMAFNKSQKVKNTRESIMKMFPDRSLISIAHPLAPSM